MKKIFALVLFLVLGKFSYSQYPLQQNLGNDSTIVVSKGATQSRFVNVTYTDTASANLQRIRQYPASLIATTSGGLRFWIRNSSATGWIEISTTSSTVGVTSVATNNATGITGGTITSTGTLAIDTLLISTRAWRQKGIDSVASLITGSVSGTTNYVSKFTATNSLGNSQIFDNGTSVGFATATPDSLLTVELGTHLKRGVRLSGLPQAPGTKSLRIDANGTLSIVDTTSGGGSGTVTSVATNNGTGITGGTITTAGTLAIDTLLISTRAWRQKGIDSLQANINGKLNISDTASMLSPYINNVGYGLGKTGQTVYADSATLSNYYLRRKDSLTTTNPLGYVTKKVLADTAAAIRSADAGGTVTSVATNNGTGITGGTITSTGTLAIDTLLISTRAWRQKGIDSVASLPRVTSVGLTMPAAFAVAGSPVTSSGTLAVTGAGLASQYIRGDGTLANFPGGGGGGGSSVSYYLNGSVNQGTFVGNTYYQMSKTPNTGASANFTIGADGYIAQFITDAGDPSLLNIPAGNWNFELYFSASSAGGNPQFYVELYKYNGSAFTLISSGSASPESITGGTVKDLYLSSLAVPATSLTLTDRLAVRIYIIHDGRTVTLYTQNGNLCQIITTFTTGITALNSLTAQVQYLTTGTSGTDFNISSLTDTHTFNLPVASATNTGKLSSADWIAFNNKVNISDTASMLSPYVNNVGYGLLKSGQVVRADSATLSNYYLRRKDSLTATNLLGYVTNKVLADTAAAIRSATTGGTVTSVATNNGTGITGGTITTSGTLAIDTLLISTRAWRQKGIDSVISVMGSRVSGTTNYVSKFTGTNTIGNSNIFDDGTNVGLFTTSPLEKLDVRGRFLSVGTTTTTESAMFVQSQWGGGPNKFVSKLAANSQGNVVLSSGYNIASATAPSSATVTEILRADYLGNVGIGGIAPDSLLTVNLGTHLKRGVRMSGLPTGVGTKALRIDANGTLSVADTTTAGVGTVTSVATNNGTGITGGTITTSGTLAIDTLLISTRAWRQKGVDSLQANINLKLNISDTTTMLSPYLRSNTAAATYVPQTRTITINGTSQDLSANRTYNVGTVTSVATSSATGITGGTFTTSGTIAADTLLLSTRLWRQKGVDSVAALPRVTSVATNTATGITGGTITTSGTIAADTLLLSTRAWRQKGIDSVAALPRVTSVGSGYGLSGGTITTSGTLLVDSATLSNYYLRRKDSLTATNLLGYVTRKILADTASAIRSAATGGTVTSVATNTGTGITGGTITTSGTLAIDTLLISTRAWRQKGIDSVATLPRVTSVATNTGTGITGGTITTSGTLALDTLLIATRAWRKKGDDSVAALLSGYVPTSRTITINGTSQDLSANRTYNVGTVTSVATSTGTGITGGTITSSGTIAADTLLLSTRAWRQKGVDSVASLINTRVSGTTNYIPKFTSSTAIGNSNLQTDASGNLGLGVTPSAWSIGQALDINGGVGVFGFSNQTYLTNNANYDGAWKYKATSAASMYFQENTGNHIWYSVASGTAGTTFSWSERMRITSAGELLVGLTSNSGLSAGSIVANGVIAAKSYLINHQTNMAALEFNSNITRLRSYGSTAGSGIIAFNVGGGNGSADAEAMRITSGGLVGIGTNTPADMVTVGTTTTGGNVRVVSSSYGTNGIFRAYGTDGNEKLQMGGLANTQAYIYTPASVDLLLYTGGSERMRITSGGNVGIGTTSPGTGSNAKFEVVQGTSTNAVARLIAPSSKTSTTQEYPFYITTSEAWASNPFGFEFGLKGNATSSSRVSYIQSMTINSTNDGILALNPNGGNVGIGTTTFNYNAAGRGQLALSGSTDAIFELQSGTTSRGYLFATAASLEIAVPSTRFLMLSTNSSEAMRITSAQEVLIATTTDAGDYKLQVNGNVYAAAYYESSDLRLKNVLSERQGSDGINTITFKWKDNRDSLTHIGYAAQQVEKVLPDAVKTNPNGYKTINYDEVQTYKIMSAEEKIKMLEERIRNLETKLEKIIK